MSSNIHYTTVNGCILAGGESARMGMDKRRLKFGGMSLLERTGLLLEYTLGRRPALVGDNLDSDIYPNFRIIPDALPGKGPLGGLVSCLRDCGSGKWALILPVDMPRISAFELEELMLSTVGGCDAAALGAQEHLEPLAAVYRGDALEFWEDRLHRGELSLQEGIRLLRFKTINIPAGSPALMNLNTSKDLHKCIIPTAVHDSLTLTPKPYFQEKLQWSLLET